MVLRTTSIYFCHLIKTVEPERDKQWDLSLGSSIYDYVLRFSHSQKMLSGRSQECNKILSSNITHI